MVDDDSSLDQDNWQLGVYPLIYPEGISKGNGPWKKTSAKQGKDILRHNSLSGLISVNQYSMEPTSSLSLSSAP